ncbi:MAG: AraC family transcriptional regulator [Fusicatenibacter sp.]|nr:AraC family transcriptional regulator [Fusicatenibacter sp.]
MSDAISWNDYPVSSSNRIVLTQEQLGIPGIRSFGWQRDITASCYLPDHFHENALELTFIINGDYTFCIRNTNYCIKRRELFIAYPNEIHSTNSMPMSVGEFYWLQLEVSHPENFLWLSHPAAESLLERFSITRRHVMFLRQKESLSILPKAFSCALSESENDRYLCASLLVTMLNLFCCESPDYLPSLTPDIDAALHYIHSNIKEDLSLEVIADKAGLSLSQFKQKFRLETGSSPRDYINRQKIEFSKQLLLKGNSVTDIAMALSFNTSSYFTSVFRKYTRCTPSEFIKNNKEKSGTVF